MKRTWRHNRPLDMEKIREPRTFTFDELREAHVSWEERRYVPYEDYLRAVTELEGQLDMLVVVATGLGRRSRTEGTSARRADAQPKGEL